MTKPAWWTAKWSFSLLTLLPPLPHLELRKEHPVCTQKVSSEAAQTVCSFTRLVPKACPIYTSWLTMLATLKYRNQRCVNRKSVEQELTKLPPHLTVSHPPHLHGPVSMGGELPALTSLSMPVWDDSWSARQQEEIVLLHNSDPWTWFFFSPALPHTLLPPTPMLLEVIQYKVTLELHTSGWALNPAFATQTKLNSQHQRREFSGKKRLAHASCRGKKIKLFQGYIFSRYKRVSTTASKPRWRTMAF